MTQHTDPPTRTARPMLRESLSETEPFLRGILASGVLLLLALAIEHLFFNRGFFSTLVLHPFWIIVLLATLESGLYVGVATAGLAALLMDWPPRPIGVDITAYFVDLAILPLQWLLAALCIGIFRQADIRALAGLRRENARLLDMNDALAAEILRADQAVRETELRVVTQRHDLGVPLAALGDLVGLDHAPAATAAAQVRAVAARFTPVPCDVLVLSEVGRRASPEEEGSSPILSGTVALDADLFKRLRNCQPAFTVPADVFGHPGQHLVLAAIPGPRGASPAGAVAFLADDTAHAEELRPLADLLARALAGPMPRAPVLRLTEDQKIPA